MKGIFLILSVFLASCVSSEKSYEFDENGMAREVLENYLDRSITMVIYWFRIDRKADGCIHTMRMTYVW